MTCHICGHSSGKTHPAREMMFGYRDTFEYFECADCGCLQLKTPPANLARYYPVTYYSYAQQSVPVEQHTNRVRRWLSERRNEAQVLNHGGVWGAIARLRTRPDVRMLPHSIGEIPGLRFRNRVLDVGCGSGKLLLEMAAIGFRDLTGVDPFLNDDAMPHPRVRLLARPLDALDDGPYDTIMFHHALEHVPDQHAAMDATRKLLAKNGTCLIRIPTVTSEVWQKYGTDWVELDAPRHYFLHSHESLRRLAEQHGLAVTRLTCDSDEFNYWASELYRRDVPLKDLATGKQVDETSQFRGEELAAFAATAADDNRHLRGGRLVAFLTRIP